MNKTQFQTKLSELRKAGYNHAITVECHIGKKAEEMEKANADKVEAELMAEFERLQNEIKALKNGRK